MANALAISDLSFSYEQESVLHQLNLSVDEGQFLALIGENGVGKSTLMNLILGRLKPSSGKISLFGDDRAIDNHYRDIAYVSQNAVLGYKYFPTTVEEVVRIELRHLKKKTSITNLLATVELEDHANRRLSELSGGQLQRVGLLLALAKDARLILLDEPTSGIDKIFSAELYQILRGLADEGRAIVLVTHHPAEATNFVDRVVRLKNGSCSELDPKLWKGGMEDLV